MNVRIVVLLSEQEDYFFIIIHKCTKVHLSLRVNVYSAKIVIIIIQQKLLSSRVFQKLPCIVPTSKAIPWQFFFKLMWLQMSNKMNKELSWIMVLWVLQASCFSIYYTFWLLFTDVDDREVGADEVVAYQHEQQPLHLDLQDEQLNGEGIYWCMPCYV